MKMKMIIAIINRLDSEATCNALRDAGFYLTQIGSIGGYLHEGNQTLLIGTEEHKVGKAMEIFRDYAGRRTECIKSYTEDDLTMETKVETKSIKVGGATVFVLNIDQFEKM